MSLSIENNYKNLSSGYKINSAADDAAGLAISQKLENQSNLYDVATDNAEIGGAMLNVADGALGSMQDALGRIRELGVKASNSALNSKEELSMIQREIDELKKAIADTAKNTQFNGLKLLDGSMADMNLATNPSGKGQTIHMANASLEALGIADFDVTKDFDIRDIDKALKKVNQARSEIGAKTNRLSYTVMSNQYASYNLTMANSLIRDTNMAEEITDLQRNTILEQLRINMQKKQMEQEQKRNNFFI
ncbi:MAG: flagellin [Lachnospiraceae bacterium]|nr:flagellin [Lachnospiraceae bacterium]